MSVLDENIEDLIDEKVSRFWNEMAKIASVAQGLHYWVVNKANWMNDRKNRKFNPPYGIYSGEEIVLEFELMPGVDLNLPWPAHTLIGIGMNKQDIVDRVMEIYHSFVNSLQYHYGMGIDLPKIKAIRSENMRDGSPMHYLHIFTNNII